MKYIVNAIWKHELSIDEERQRAYMRAITETLNSEEYVLETIWYRIDEHTHGSVAVYKSEEAYNAFLEINEMQRNFAAEDHKVSMLEQYKGPAFAVQTDLD